MSNEAIKYIVVLCTTGNNLDDLEINIKSLESQDVNIYLIIVTQGNHDSVENILQNSNIYYKHICDSGKGLSRARNIALKNVYPVVDYKDSLLIFSDDDNWYPENSLKEAYRIVKNSNNSICVFQYYDEKKRQFPKKYSQKSHFMSYLDILHVSSIEIVINLNKVNIDLLNFNEDLGVGTKITSGEENELMIRLRRQGFKIYFYPFIISYHPYKIKNIVFDSRYFNEKKQLFKILYGKVLGRLLYILFFMKKKLINKQ